MEKVKKEKKLNTKSIKIGVYVYCGFLALCVIIPFYVVLVTSITSWQEIAQSELEAGFIWWPKQIDFSSYEKIFEADYNAINGIPTLLRSFINTIWMTLFTVGFNLFFSSLAAYAYTKIQFKGKEVIFMIQLATMMIPGATMTIPSVVFYNMLGWVGTPLPVLIPGMFGGASAIFFFRAYFQGISNEYFEAAKIDGLGEFQCFLRIMLPLSVPAFVAQFIFMFVNHYNNYTSSLIYLSYDPSVYTLQYVVDYLTASYEETNIKCAIALTALTPLVVIYLFVQKLFIEGVQAGGGKE